MSLDSIDNADIKELEDLADPPGVKEFLEVYGPRSGYDYPRRTRHYPFKHP